MTELDSKPAAALADRKIWMGWSFGLTSVLAFSIAPPVASAIIKLGLDPTTMLFVRLWLTTALLGSTFLLTAPGQLWIGLRGLLISSIAGLTTAVSMLLYYWSLTRLDTSVASMLFSIYPLVIFIFLALTGEKFTHRNTVRLAFGLTGVYFLLGPGGQVDWLGVWLVLLSTVVASFQILFIQWFLQDYDARAITFYMVGGMALVISGWWLIQGPDLYIPGWQAWLGIGVTAVISTYLARLAMFAAVRRLGSAQVALLTPLETLLTVIWSLLFLQERLSFLQTVGGGLILVSALLATNRLANLRGLRWRPR